MLSLYLFVDLDTIFAELLSSAFKAVAELLSSAFKAVSLEHSNGNEDEHSYGNGMGIVMDWGWECKIPMVFG